MMQSVFYPDERINIRYNSLVVWMSEIFYGCMIADKCFYCIDSTLKAVSWEDGLTLTQVGNK